MRARRTTGDSTDSPTAATNEAAAATVTPTSEDVFRVVHNIIIDQIGVDDDEVTMDSRFVDDIGCDSLDTIELVMAAEDEFGIDISDTDVEQFETVRHAVEYLVGRKVTL